MFTSPTHVLKLRRPIYILLMVKWTFDKEKFTHRITSFLLTRSIVVTNKMSEEIPVIPKVTSLTVHSGNIVNWNRLKRHPNHGATAEVKSCLFTSSKYSTEVLNLRSITHYIIYSRCSLDYFLVRWQQNILCACFFSTAYFLFIFVENTLKKSRYTYIFCWREELSARCLTLSDLFLFIYSISRLLNVSILH